MRQFCMTDTTMIMDTFEDEKIGRQTFELEIFISTGGKSILNLEKM